MGEKYEKNGRRRLSATIFGAVQGVGFRPFVYRLATGMGLTGWVNNSNLGVLVEVEGEQPHLEEFLLRLEREKPPRSFIQGLQYSYLDPVNYESFEIRPSDHSGVKSALVLPDIAVCPDCLKEIFDPADRRYLYPFTNCTNCGPRHSIIRALPYDRSNTTMNSFVMCEECRNEYENPLDRRFHAQPNACPVCGPHLELWDPKGNKLAERNDALPAAAADIVEGKILAVKGIGGYHLMVDARNDAAVERLRQLKRREEKPLAVMYPSLDSARQDCRISEMECRLLLCPESPIVLVEKLSGQNTISNLAAPNNPYLGLMLPYAPLHHLLLRELGFPVVATSGNISDEPICIDNNEALDRLQGIADFFLVHNRPIVRPIDDSVVRFMAGRQQVIRRARGFAPLPIRLKAKIPPILAVGGHLKNSLAIAVGSNVFISQHIGDLETEPAYDSFKRTARDMQNLYEIKPEIIACDLHPDYISSRFAHAIDRPVFSIQHHYAHILSAMAENELAPPALGVAWDGTGYGPDKTIWGGEFLKITDSGFERTAHFRYFPLPGGETAVKEPRRSAIGILYEIFGRDLLSMRHLAPVASFSPHELETLLLMLDKSLNTQYTSSAGRLFDAVASLTGIRQQTRFEGQAAMELEFALSDIKTDEAYTCVIDNTDIGFSINWETMVKEIIEDLNSHTASGIISAKFHNAMAEVIVDISNRSGQEKIVLSGGCFQNKYLTERTIKRLKENGFQPYWQQRVPPNDGGLSLGQIMAAAIMNEKERS
mgnify:CR=1 FL=1